MDIKIRRLHAERVFSFPSLLLEENDLIHPKAVFGIRGRNLDIDTDNGVGKTTVIRVMYYGLYGVDLFGTPLDHISNDRLNSGHFVSVEFSVGENNYSIMRFHNFTPYDGGPILDRSEKKGKFKGLRFYKVDGDNKIPLIGESDSETQEFITQILGVSPRMAKSIFFIPQGHGSPLLSATPADSQDILMEFFPLEFIDEAEKKNGDSLKDEKVRQKELLDSKTRLLADIELKKSDLDVYSEKSQIFENKRNEKLSILRKEYSVKNKELKSLDFKTEAPLDTKGAEENVAQLKLELISLKGDMKIVNIKESIKSARIFLEKTQNEISILKEEKTIIEIEMANLRAITSSKDPLEIRNKRDQLKLQLDNLSDLRSLGSKERLLNINNKLSSIASSRFMISELSKRRNEMNSHLNELRSLIGINTLKLDDEPQILNEIKSSSIELSSVQEKLNYKIFTLGQREAEIVDLSESKWCKSCRRPWGSDHDHEEMVISVKKEIEAINLEISSLLLARSDINKNIEVKNDKLNSFNILRDILSVESSLIETSAKLDQLIAISAEEESLLEEKLALSSSRSEDSILAEIKSLDENYLLSEKMLFRINELKEKLITVSSALSNLAENELKIKIIVNDESEKLADAETSLQDNIKLIEGNIESSSNELNLILNKNKMIEYNNQKYSSKKAELDAILMRADEVKTEVNPYIDLIERSNSKISELESRVVIVEGRLLECVENLFVLEFWREGFGPKGIKSFVVDDIIDILNDKIKNKLSDFGFDGAIGAIFTPESSNKKGIISNEIKKTFTIDSKDKPWENLSGGQQGRIKFAVNLSIREIAEERSKNRFTNVFFDEPFDGLCSSGQQTAMRLLMDIAREKDGVVIITHDAGLQQMCSNSIYFVMKNKASYKVSKNQFDHPMSFTGHVPDLVEN